MIGVLYESDEWSDWKLGRELEAACARITGHVEAAAEGRLGTTGADGDVGPVTGHFEDDVPTELCGTTAGKPATAQRSESPASAGCVASADSPGAPSMRFVRMVNVEEPDCVEQAKRCELLVGRVFASAPFRGHFRAHGAMERVIAMADERGIPLINPGRAHRFEIDKRLAADTLRAAGISAPVIIACGTPERLLGGGTGQAGRVHAGAPFCDGADDRGGEVGCDSRAVFDGHDEIERMKAHSEDVLGEAVESWPYPCVIKPNCGGRTTHTAVLHDSAQARTFLETAPAMEFIVEPFVESRGGFLTRLELVDGKLALAVKRSVAANGLSSYHEGSTYELYPDCPGPVVDAVLSAGQLLGIEFGSFDVIESDQGDVIIDANSVSNVSEDCTELFGGFDLMAAYAQAIAARWHETALR